MEAVAQQTTSRETYHPLTGEIIPLDEVNELVNHWTEIQEQIRQLRETKDRLDLAILDHVEQPEDSNTAHLETGEHHLVIQFKEKEDWDQKKLSQAYFLLGDKADDLLKTQYKVDKRRWKAFRNTKMTQRHLREAQVLLETARVVTPKKPYITLQ